jgi:hypothetical protein
MNDKPNQRQLEWIEDCPDCERALEEIRQHYQEQLAQAYAEWRSEHHEFNILPYGHSCKCVLIPVQSKRLSIWHRLWNRIRNMWKVLGA